MSCHVLPPVIRFHGHASPHQSTSESLVLASPKIQLLTTANRPWKEPECVNATSLPALCINSCAKQGQVFKAWL